MATQQYTDPSQDYRSMYDMTDLKRFKSIKNTYITPGSLMSILKEDRFSYVAHLVRVAQFEALFNSCNLNYTLLIPTNDSLKEKYAPRLLRDFFANIDNQSARQIIQYSTIPRIASYSLLTQSPHQYVTTRLNAQRILFQNNTINDDIHFSEPTIVTTNGLIHIIDNLLIPETTDNNAIVM